MGLFNRKKQDKKETEKIERLKQEITKRIETAVSEGRFSIFMCNDMKKVVNSNSISLENLEFFFDLCEFWDDKCHIPLEFGNFLNEISEDSTVVVGVRRVKLNYGERINGIPSSEELEDAMQNGAKNQGHINAVGGSATMDIPDPSLAFTPLRGMSGFINLVASYHENNTVLLAGFPSDIVDDHLGIIDNSRVEEIYDITNPKVPRVRPDYMMCAIVKNEHGLDEVFTRDEIISSKMSK